MCCKLDFRFIIWIALSEKPRKILSTREKREKNIRLRVIVALARNKDERTFDTLGCLDNVEPNILL